jgi:hypothetical protein
VRSPTNRRRHVAARDVGQMTTAGCVHCRHAERFGRPTLRGTISTADRHLSHGRPMSKRANALATRLEDGANALATVASSLTDGEWET